MSGPHAAGALTTADGQLRDPDHQPAEQQLVPTVLQWSHGGSTVHVTGSFNHWGERIPLRRSGAEFVVCLNLVPGTYQFKFIVDNEWRYATDQQTVRDQMGNVNNCVTVEDQAIYLHEDPASGFFSDGAVANAYTQRLPDEITLAKEPPLAPPHLAMLPLNLPSSPEPRIASWTLLPPASVTLQHMVTQRERTPEGATILSCTHRFRTKFVTIVIHKPSAALLLAQSAAQQQQAAAAAAAAAAQQQQQLAAQQQQEAIQQQQAQQQQMLLQQQQAAAAAAAQQQQQQMPWQMQQQMQQLTPEQQQQLLAVQRAQQQERMMQQQQWQAAAAHLTPEQQQQLFLQQQQQQQYQQQQQQQQQQPPPGQRPPHRGVSWSDLQLPNAMGGGASGSMPPPPLPVRHHPGAAVPGSMPPPFMAGPPAGGMGGMAQPGMQSMDAPQAMDLSSRPGSHQAYMDSYGGGAGPMQLPDGFGGCSHAMGGVPPAFGQPGAGGHVPMEGTGGVQGSNVFGQPPAGHVPFGGSPPVFGIMPPGAVFDPTGAQQQQHGDCGAAGGNGNRNDVVM